MRHQLSLEIPDTGNKKIFRVADTSIYAEGLSIDCGYLSIKSPGFKDPVYLEILPYFNLVLNACTLGISNGSCADLSPTIPDGIYTVGYAVSPTDKVFVEYNYLRTACIMNTYYEALCMIEASGCDPTVDIKNKLKELRLIRSFIETAKIKVEYCNEPQKGMELLLYAQKRLKKFVNTCE